MTMFVHLHVHSHYSLLDGASSPADLCQQAKALGYTALALTDTNGLYGALPFRKAAQEAGVRPVFGAELTRALPAVWNDSSAVVLAKDQAGFAELCRLITRRQLDKGFELISALQQTTLHVAVLTPDVSLAVAVAKGRRRHNVYLELSDLSERGDPGCLALQAQRAAQAGLPVVASNRVHFAFPEDHAVHRAMRAIALRATLGGLRPQDCMPKAAHLKPPSEMRERFRQVPGALERAGRLAESCQAAPGIGNNFIAGYACPEGEDEFSYLSKICFEGLRRRYRPLTPQAIQTLARELAVIQEKHFSGYFLTVWDIAEEARRRGIPTVGRGSAANSIVSYCLGITHVDPIRCGLFFERFLNPEREDPPDIDLDFPWDQRDEMLAYAYQRFDRKRVAMICTILRFHARSAVREAGKVMGLSENEVSAFSRRLPHMGEVAEVEAAQIRIPEMAGLPTHEEPWRTVMALAAKLNGAPRCFSVHPGGIVIAPGPVDEAMPKQMSAKGLEVTQYDMYAAEDAGFVKIDLLGQRGLAVIRDVLAATGLDWSRVDPLRDSATRRLMREGQTLGCFYIESPAMRLLLRKLKCNDFELLTAASSSIRPGVSNSGMMRMFVERHLGRQPVRYAHPKMERLLRQTYGVMVYQEDVIKVVHALAGMSLGEADKLRRCMSKKRHWEKIETYHRRFAEGCRGNGIPEPAIAEIWRQVESFGGYAFCKAHSASYAQLSFQSAYLKVHFPAAFMAAVLSNQGGFYAPAVYLEEARRLGLEILLPDVNQSLWHYRACGQAIRVGLLSVKGLTEAHGRALVAECEAHGPFETLSDLCRRTPVSVNEAEYLIAAGACDRIGPQAGNRPRLRWELALFQRSRRHQPPDAPELPLPLEPEVPEVTASLPDEIAAEEFNQLELLPRSHPLMLFRSRLSELTGPGWVEAADLAQHAGRRVRIYGWLVTWRRNRVQKTGEMMKFVTLEDFTGTFEVTLFPKAYQEYGRRLDGYGPYVVEGIVENDHGGITITGEQIQNLGSGLREVLP